MGTVTIGGRELEVKPATLGFLKRRLLPWRATLEQATTEEQQIDAVIAGLLLYVGHNPDVTTEWLEEHVPADPREVLSACAAAAGQKASAKGEASGP